MLEATRPTSFGELVRISGLSHGTDVWLNNAQDLISQVYQLKQVICTRDDIMTYLISQKEKKQAFNIMERVRKGRGLSKRIYLDGKGRYRWYIQSCQKIKYMFPTHAVAYVTMAYRILL